MIESKITSKGQITIPKPVREFLDVDVSDIIQFDLLDNGKVLISRSKRSAEALFGMLSHRKRRSPVSLEQMENAIRERRLKRGLS